MSRACSFCVPPWFVACLCDRQAGQWSGLSWNHTRRMPCGPEWQLGNRTTRITRTFFSSSIWLIPVFDCWTWNDNGRSRTGSVSFFLYKIHLNSRLDLLTLKVLSWSFAQGRGGHWTDSTYCLQVISSTPVLQRFDIVATEAFYELTFLSLNCHTIVTRQTLIASKCSPTLSGHF